MKNKSNHGFTLMELLVSLSIVTLIMISVLWNYSSFNDDLALTSAAQEMAIAVRKAQTYGLTVKEVTPGGGQFSFAYGVHFDPTNDPNNYYIFADINANHKYDAGAEIIEKYPLRNNVKVGGICDGSSCPPTNARTLDILFLRPNPDAGIYFYDVNGTLVAGPSTTGKITLSSFQGKTRTITVESTGQVSVQ
jgi:prepilin-type N-terminal cleavage/methylation domain-containing protein